MIQNKVLEELQDRESSYGKVHKVSGPLVIAKNMVGAQMFELVRVGWDKLFGEIIQLNGEYASIQCYENTTGLSGGDPVQRTKQSFQVELGPGLLTQIFDGIQRPLEVYAKKCGSIYMPGGVDIPPLDHDKSWHFVPDQNIKESIISGGDIYGSVFENNLFNQHKIMLAPKVQGRVTYIAPDGNYTLDDQIIEVEFDGKKTSYGMSHLWPVREARPFVEKLQGNEPLLTGQRVLDALYPSVLGGKCCIPGAFGCGKTCISQALSQHSNCECNIYVACGERGNEIAEILGEFQEQTITMKGMEENVMLKTCLVANTSNMPVAAREASIYTGITFAEYFRDMGYNVSLMADSTTRWAEALREMQILQGGIPADQGYPAYITSKLAQFYERAGKIRCRGSPDREGSITIVGAVSPAGGDFTDPVTTATLSLVQVFWGLDRRLAQRKHFPSVNWNISYSNYEQQLEAYYSEYHPGFKKLKSCFKRILEEENELIEIVQLLGRDSLGDEQRLTLEVFFQLSIQLVARLIREDFLQQNSFSRYDYICPIYKTIGMMKAIVCYYECGKQAILQPLGNKIPWYTISHQTRNLFQKLCSMKFEDPQSSKQDMENHFSQLCDEITDAFTIIRYK